MSTPAAKRRRLDIASQTLSKPFRSPFKTPFKSPAKRTGSASTPTPTPTAGCQAQDASAKEDGDASTKADGKESVGMKTPLAPRTTNSLVNRSYLSSSTKPSLNFPSTPAACPGKKKAFSSPIATSIINSDPIVTQLLKEQRILENELKVVKEELDTAEQAKKIEAHSRKWLEKRNEEGLFEGNEERIDGELVVLVGKWRGASRGAAEEMFGHVRDRVNRMGGPRAWKEMQKKQQEFQNQWNQEEPSNNDSDDEDEDAERKDVEKRDLYAEYDVDPETENEKSQRARIVGDTGEEPGQEDEFTMAMMLRTLNVDLEKIGYDRQQQRWVD